jgi:hypothetical protein
MIKKLILVFLFLCSNAFAGITDLKLSTAQIFDVQWNISGGRLNVSGFNYIYSSVNYATQTNSAARWTAAQTADAGANGRYIGFFNSTTHPGTYGMAVFNVDGSTYKIINNTGSFRTLADGAIFYNGNGMWGTLITTKQGYSLGQSAQFTLTQEYPTNSQLQAYTPPSSTPLAAGQTAGPPPPAPTAIYMNNAAVRITRAIPTTNNSPGGEGPNNAFDNNVGTKYLNFDKKNAGVTVQLNTGRAVTGFTVTTANDFSGRDPTSYKLYGSNDGSTWTLIKQDSISLSESRFWTSSVISTGNTTPYAYYFMLFPTTKAGDGCGLNCDSMQIAEITYYYDANSTSTSSASSSTIVDPVTASANTLCCGGSAAPISADSAKVLKVNQFTNRTTADAMVYIEQIGNSNTITIQQTGTRNNYVNYTGNGSFNTVNITQSGTSSTLTNYVDLTVGAGTAANNNTVNITQNSTGGGKAAFVNISAHNNSLILQQKDSGNHWADVTLAGGSKNVDVTQQGSAGHMTKITLSGLAVDLSLTQSGNTQQHYSINFNCATAGGCQKIIVQQGP